MPEHFKAYTLWLAFILGFGSFIYLGMIYIPLGFVGIVVGLFIGDQATHLSQADHSSVPPTAIERWQQNNPNFAKLLGTLIAIAGAYLICSQIPYP
jgi:hypothetical protein